MTNHPQLPQDTLDCLAMLEASQEERDAALAKLVVISKDDLYRILSRRASSQDIDEDWQEIMQAGAIIASQPDRPDGDELRTFNIAGTILRRTVNIFTIACESAEIADRVANQLRTPTRDGAEGVVRCRVCADFPPNCWPADCPERSAPPKPAPSPNGAREALLRAATIAAQGAKQCHDGDSDWHKGFRYAAENTALGIASDLERAANALPPSPAVAAEPVAWQHRNIRKDGTKSDWMDCSEEHAKTLREEFPDFSETRPLYAKGDRE